MSEESLINYIRACLNKGNYAYEPIVISNYSYNYFIFSRHNTKEIRRVIRDAKHFYRSRKKYKRAAKFIDEYTKSMLTKQKGI